MVCFYVLYFSTTKHFMPGALSRDHRPGKAQNVNSVAVSPTRFSQTTPKFAGTDAANLTLCGMVLKPKVPPMISDPRGHREVRYLGLVNRQSRSHKIRRKATEFTKTQPSGHWGNFHVTILCWQHCPTHASMLKRWNITVGALTADWD